MDLTKGRGINEWQRSGLTPGSGVLLDCIDS